MNTYYLSKELFHHRIEVNKDESYFIYFILESNEGLCFYSTANFEKGQSFREIHIWGPIEWETEVSRILEQLNQRNPFLSYHKDIVRDSL